MAKNKIKAKTAVKAKKAAKKIKKDKTVGKIEHIFDKIGVVTTTLKSPLKVGDIIRIKGHTTDIVQEVGSIQIEHESVQKAKKGDGVGIKIKGVVRDNDAIYLADKKAIAAFRQDGEPSAPSGRAIAASQVFVNIKSSGFSAPESRHSTAVASGQSPQLQKRAQIPGKAVQDQPKFFSF